MPIRSLLLFEESPLALQLTSMNIAWMTRTPSNVSKVTKARVGKCRVLREYVQDRLGAGQAKV